MAVDKPLSTINNPALPDIKRKDAYWVEPALIVIVFVAFIIYVTWRTFENNYFDAAQADPRLNYLSPLYSPNFSGAVKGWHLFGMRFSPAILILPVPLLFRTTCYYYRKAYYRAFFGDPSACAVKEALAGARKNYTGERAFPLILQNIHRYAFYLAAIVMVVLWYDAILAFTVHTPTGLAPYVGVGSIIFLVNVILLSLYTFSCHSWRHLAGGCVNCYSRNQNTKTRHGIWQRITHLNENHQLWAWCSLFSVALTDLYVRLVASGAIHFSHI
jgi:hypothetical protein